MPGIAGIISRKSAAECQGAVKNMVATMQRASCHKTGTFSVPDMGLFVGLVADENSFTASRYLLNEQQDVVLIFSGECFLDTQIGVELGQNGHEIGTNRSTWPIHLYEQEGEQFVRNLNGLFSGLLIDKRLRKAFLFNDRYGMERIYVHERNSELYFASEAKALLRVLPELRTFDEQGVAQFLAYGCTLEERTLFKGISRLPGGSLWSFESGSCLKNRYFSPESWESQTPVPVEQFESEFQSTFRRILPRYTDSKMPLGISLTAGLDTRMIMACLPEMAMNAVCYTYSGENTDTLDTRLAARVATACGLEHKILRLRADFFAEFSTWADKTIYATDGCFGITGAHEIYLSCEAYDLSPIRLTGIFGGEIFRNVSTFKPINLSSKLFQHQVTARGLHYENEHPVTFAAFKEIPCSMFGTVAACRSQLFLRSPYLDNELVALAYRAPLSLRNSCDSAVRFVRNCSKAVANIPTDMGHLGNSSRVTAALSRMLAKVTFKFDYYYSHGLPRPLAGVDPVFRPLAACLQHFGSHRFLHYHNWFRKELASYVKESLTDAQTLQSPFWNANFIKRMAEEHASGRENYTQEINAVLTLTAIERLLFKNFSRQSEEPALSGHDSGIISRSSVTSVCSD